MKQKFTLTLINIVFIIFAVLWMGIIFYMSNRTADESNNASDVVETAIGMATIEGFEQQTEEEMDNFLLKYRVYIRKAAHVLEFTLLCMLVFMVFPFMIPMIFRLIGAGVWTLLYAISDEIHQSFIPGRTGLVSDVLIDMIGMVLGIIGILIINWLYKVIKARRKLSTEE